MYLHNINSKGMKNIVIHNVKDSETSVYEIRKDKHKNIVMKNDQR